VSSWPASPLRGPGCLISRPGGELVRATRDSDLLVPDGAAADGAIHRFLERVDAARLNDGRCLGPDDIDGADHLRVRSRHGIIDVLRGGLPPLDHDTVATDAIILERGGEPAPFASLRSLGRLQAPRGPRPGSPRPREPGTGPWRAPDRPDPGTRRHLIDVGGRGRRPKCRQRPGSGVHRTAGTPCGVAGGFRPVRIPISRRPSASDRPRNPRSDESLPRYGRFDRCDPSAAASSSVAVRPRATGDPRIDSGTNQAAAPSSGHGNRDVGLRGRRRSHRPRG
jgi:hypothetical protein